LLVALLGVVLSRNRQQFTRPPLDLTPPAAQTVEPRDGSKEADTAPAVAAAPVIPPAVSEPARETPVAAPRKTVAPDAGDKRSAAVHPPPSAALDEVPAPAIVISEPFTPIPTTVEALPGPLTPVAAGHPALEDIAAAAVPPPPPPPVTITAEPLSGVQLAQADITRTLDAYRESYSALNASAVSMIWVGLDTKALQRAFSTLSRQDLEFDHCDLDISGAQNRARASCTGVLNYVRRIGSGDEHQRQMSWAIDLVRRDDRWLIENVTAR
jgi:hypothetical protein